MCIYFWSSLQSRGFRHLGCLWKRHAALVPAQIHLFLGSRFDACPHLMNNLAPPDNVNTTQQLARPAAVLPLGKPRGREDAPRGRGGGESAALISPLVSLLGDRRGQPRTRLPFSGKQVAQTKTQRTKRAPVFTNTHERKPAHRSRTRQDPGAARAQKHARTRTWVGDARGEGHDCRRCGHARQGRAPPGEGL